MQVTSLLNKLGLGYKFDCVIALFQSLLLGYIIIFETLTLQRLKQKQRNEMTYYSNLDDLK